MVVADVRNAFAVLVCLVLTACADGITGTTVIRAERGDGSEPVQRLFAVDGCTVYRFFDYGYPRYFAKCNAASVTTTAQECHLVGKVTTCSDTAIVMVRP